MRASEVSLEWLDEHGLQGKEGADGHYLYWCPVHDDFGSSHKGLSVTCPKWPKTKPVLCKCHSPQCGATLVAVIAALNGTTPNGEQELRVRVTKQRVRKSGLAWYAEKTGVPTEFWEELGVIEVGNELRFPFDGEDVVKVRRGEKDYLWIPSKGITPPLWPMPEDELPEHIWITEGESDCGTARYVGFHAYAATKGAQTPLPVEVFQTLASRGVQEVTICTDRGGEIFASHVAKSATDAFLRVNVVDFTRVINPLTGLKDLNDVWQECVKEGDDFHAILKRATYRVEENRKIFVYEDLEEILQEEHNWAVNGLVSFGDKIMIAGPPKSFKTWTMLDLAHTLVDPAHAFLNRPDWVTERPLNVLLVEEEGSRYAFAQRLTRLPPSPNLFWMHKMGVAFNDSMSISSLIHVMRKEEINVVFFDPLQRMIPGLNENDSSETGVIWDEVFRMQAAIPDLVVCILHHANKSERLTQESIRGSSRHAGEVDLWVLVEKTDTSTMRLTMDGRDVTTGLGPGEAIEGRVQITDDAFAIDSQEFAVRVRQTKVDHNRADVLKALGDGCDTRTRIMKHTGLSDNTIIKYLKALVEEQLVVETKGEDGKPNTYSLE